MSINIKEPVGLYIHIPFCIQKCNYCDFYSINYEYKKLKEFVNALKNEIKIYGNNNIKLKSIYFGGGTPTLLYPEMLDDIVTSLKKHFLWDNEIEFTIEANPSTINPKKIKSYPEIGINRISIGVQSFNDKILSLLGRVHSSAEAREKLKIVDKIFTNYNLDLIFAIPGQSKEDFHNSINSVLEFNPPHLSIYNLQLEKGTKLKERVDKGEIKPISQELDAKMYEMASSLLRKHGYQHYEISNFSFPGFESKHNLQYWYYLPYIGLGPAAHSFTGKKRYYNISNIEEYINQLDMDELPIKQELKLNKNDLMSEMMMMGLRLRKGVSFNDFYRRFNVKLDDVYEDEINMLKDKGLIEVNEEKIKLTSRGLFLGNQVFKEFIKC